MSFLSDLSCIFSFDFAELTKVNLIFVCKILAIPKQCLTCLVHKLC